RQNRAVRRPPSRPPAGQPSCKPHEPDAARGAGLPVSSRRTFTSALRAVVHCMSAALRQPWLRMLP
ncbi:MAG: hypothetical protein ACK559_03340, partial [bacterium]